MALKVPRHSVTATPVYIARNDPAWDFDRVTREQEEVSSSMTAWAEDCDRARKAEKELPPRPPGEDDRPVNIYYSGEGRYDLDARYPWKGERVSARDYLKGEPTRFILRRMPMAKYAKATDWIQQRVRVEGMETAVTSEWRQIMLFCAKHGLADVQGLEGFTLAFSGDQVSEESMRQLHDIGGMGLIEELGLAAYRVSQPLSDSEKKA